MSWIVSSTYPNIPSLAIMHCQQQLRSHNHNCNKIFISSYYFQTTSPSTLLKFSPRLLQHPISSIVTEIMAQATLMLLFPSDLNPAWRWWRVEGPIRTVFSWESCVWMNYERPEGPNVQVLMVMIVGGILWVRIVLRVYCVLFSREWWHYQ